MMKPIKPYYLRNLIYFLAACISAAACLFTLYRYDNKYTALSAKVQYGYTLVSSEDLTNDRVLSLTDGWEIFPDRILSPSDFSAEQDNAIHTYIGRYLNFSDLHSSRDPYGTATYRVRIQVANPEEPLTLYLPEVSSALTVYVNGHLAASQGSLSPYRPMIKDLAVSLPEAQELDLVIQTANYTHYYSGITYPPVLGTAQAIHRITRIRLMFYGFLCFSSLSIALFSCAVWLGSRRSRPMEHSGWFGIMALAFSLRLSYPLWLTFGISHIRIFYALENVCSMVGIWCALKIVFLTAELKRRRFIRLLENTALSMIFVTVALPVFLLPSIPAFTDSYGVLVSWYKLITSLIMAAGSCLCVKNSCDGWLAAGTGVYACGILASVLTINRLEPVYTGWPDEFGAYGMVICFAVLMVRKTYSMVMENLELTNHLQEAVEMRTREVNALVDERQKLFSEFLHDLKSPMASLSAYIQLVQSNNIQIDEETSRKLSLIEDRCQGLSAKLQAIQHFTKENPVTSQMDKLDLTEYLRLFYQRNQQDIEAFGPDFKACFPVEPCMVWADSQKLERLLQNLIYNAVDFTPMDLSLIHIFLLI